MMPQPAQKYPESAVVLARPVIVTLGLLLILLAGCQPVMPEEPASAATIESPAAAGAITATVTVEESSVSAAEVAETAAMTESATVTSSATITTSQLVTEAAPVPADAPSGSSEAGSPELIEAGLAVYRQQYCGVCHRLSAAGTQGTFGPPHDGMGKTAAARIADPGYTGSATTPAEYIRESLINPSIYLVPGYVATPHRMPPYSHLDPASLDALVAMLLAQ